ncbi:MAG TPA: efflux RND transporter periplasmic adaptor subunit [Vicinamibacterales bacterium]|nr:efflux RND transporter periplasmic adaptor subunit [Vicinamibacterales bacterium]
MRSARVPVVFFLAAAAATLFIPACTRGTSQAQAPPGGGRGAAPPVAVSTITLQEQPIEQSSEFIATLRSQRATTIQPEIAGVISQILVKPGDRVRIGTPLIQVNADRQAAAVRSSEASRTGTESDVQYWRGQVKRLEALVEAGAISRQEFEQAQNSLRTAEARLAALDAQVREERVQLQYYRVAAPQAGVVGDIAVRVGDRVTPSTIITTIDDNSALEADIHVPLDRSPDLRLGLPVHLLSADGQVMATNPVTFVAPRVDDRTQTVLVKSALKDAPPSLRAQQFARVRIVWRETPVLSVPVTAVQRVGGLYFVYVADPADGGLVARQRPVTLGELVRNEYIVLSGLQAGDRVITSGIQKIGNGAPVRPQ